MIVFPHWGTEYGPTPFPASSGWPATIIDAGADMVIGNHAHWAGRDGGLQGQADLVRARQLRVRPDLVRADDGGDHARADVPRHDLVQARMRPHIILDKAQPNFLDPAGDGKVVMGQVFDASKGLLPW